MPYERKSDFSETAVEPGSPEAFGLLKIQNGVGRLTYVVAIKSSDSSQQLLRIGDTRTLTLEQAIEKARVIQVDLARAKAETGLTARVIPQHSFADFVKDYYLPFILANQRSTSAVESYLRNWIVPLIGDKVLDEILKRDIVFMINSFRISGLKPGSVNRALNVVKSCFTKAIEWELCSLSESPAKGVAEIKNPASKERFLSQLEAQRLISILQQSRNAMLFPIVGFLLMTGARRSEVLNAQWEDFNLESNVWLITRSKSGKPRRVPLSAQALSFLEAARRVANGSDASKDSVYAFCNPKTGRAFRNIFNSWNKARERADLKNVRLHDLRHSFASALVNNGLSIYDVKELLGHASINTTQRYAHLSQERLAKATDTVADYYIKP